MSLSTGTRLGPHEIETPIGAGGMGEVYRAKDTRLDRTVAVKVLPSELSSKPGLRQRFEREARAIASLNHPHICPLYDVGAENGIDFLVMEYLEGETLADRLSHGALKAERFLRYAIQIVDALDKAHRQAFVHQDLKPGNIMLTRSGVKLLDFGLAKFAAQEEVHAAEVDGTAATLARQPLTVEGTIVGTLPYMAQEQVESTGGSLPFLYASHALGTRYTRDRLVERADCLVEALSVTHRGPVFLPKLIVVC
jgi:serine/threonine protein kinase